MSTLLPPDQGNDGSIPVAPAAHLSTALPTSTQERLAALVRKSRGRFGDAFDPLLELTDIAMQARQEGDIKTAVTALTAVADRWYPKLKAHEVQGEQRPIINLIQGDPNSAGPAVISSQQPATVTRLITD